MSYTKRVIQQHRLKPADVVVVGFGPGLIAHYVTYMGVHNGEHYFVANVSDGVRYFRPWELDQRAQGAHLKRVRRFEGSPAARQAALQRAHRAIGRPYSFLGFNCESAANLIQYNQEVSRQVQVGTGIALGAVVIGFLALVFSGSDENNNRRGRYS